MVVVNNDRSRVATVRVERRLPNRKNNKLAIFVVTPGQQLVIERESWFPVQVGEGSGSVSISSDLEVQVYL